MAEKPSKIIKRVTGTIELNRRGVGYVPFESHEDIEIETKNLHGALNGDEVEVEIRGMKLGRGKAALHSPMRPHGAVLRVIKRAREEFICTLQQGVGVPADFRFYRPIQLKNTDKAKEGDKILVKLLSFTGEKDPQGEIIEILGNAGEHRVEMNAIVMEHGFRTEFPFTVLKEAKEIEEKHKETIASEIPKRKDFRGVTTFTIDPLTAKDFDDALSIRELENDEYEIGVHIADVSFFVREGTALNEEAKKRGTSVYLVDATIPMLPEELSGDVCSLKEGVDRLVFSAVFRINKKAEVIERVFERSIIRSNKRFTYEEAQEILDKKEGPYIKELTILRDLSRILRKKREEQGAIDFGDNEVKFELDSEGKVLSIKRKERIETNLLIEEFMLLANHATAEYMAKIASNTPGAHFVFPYRVHDKPKEDRIEELAVFVRALGYEFGNPKKKQYTAKDIRKLLKDIQGKPEEPLIRTAALRSMAKAIYTIKNIGHFGLALEYYTHFTSPIRRYPDVLVHRILGNHLEGSPLKVEEYATLERQCVIASEQEAQAAEAERESVKYKQVEYMQDKIGKTFDAIVSGVTDWGLYVEDTYSAAEGLVRIASIGNEFYRYDQKSYSLVGEKTGKKYALGDAVRVKLVNADLSARQLDFELV